MPTDRREFLKHGLLAAGVVTGGAAAAVSILSEEKPQRPASRTTLEVTRDGELVVHGDHAGLPSRNPEVRRGVPGRRWVMVIDLAACNGCGKCTESCNTMHHTPGDRAWMRVFRMKNEGQEAPYWFPRPCFHCDNPPCTRVCPVDATFKRQDGIVLVDTDRCIGCRFCMAACPYSARVFNWSRPGADSTSTYSPEKGYPRKVGTVEKCDFCPEQLQNGQLPACGASCDMGAIYFGDEVEDAVTNSKGQTVRLTTLLKDRGAYRHLEELGTKPRVYYLPPVHRRYPVPDQPIERPATEHA